MESLIEEARRLPEVPEEAAAAYAASATVLAEAVNARMERRPDLGRLIGGNPVETMAENHAHHAGFLATVFTLRQPALLARTLPWVYRAYGARGFSLDYFPVELEAWMGAIRDRLPPALAPPVLATYEWMLRSHERVAALAGAERGEGPTSGAADDDVWGPVRDRYLAALLSGDPAEAREAAGAVRRPEQLEGFFVSVVQPAMYELGRRWERGEVSVAQEHLASAITTRVLAGLSAVRAPARARRGRAVVSAAPNEFHELGAWMLSDLLEADGWTVDYLGANTPAGDLVRMVRERRPALVALSVTMPFNLGRTREIIEAIRREPAGAAVGIMVGGLAFAGQPGLWRDVGADAWAEDVRGAVARARDFAPAEARA